VRRAPILILISAAVGLVALTGCGSDGDARAESSAVAPASTPAPTTAAPAPTAPPATEAAAPPPPPPVATYVVIDVIDGDTLDLDNGERVRLVGIDSPDAGECGDHEATAVLSAMALDQTVTLEPSDEDRDKYDRLLRYVFVNGVDLGGQMLAQGYAVPRYNSTDGYGRHPREAEYAARAQPLVVTCAPPPPAPTAPAVAPVPRPAPVPALSPAPAPAPSPSAVSYRNCDAVRAAGAAPIRPGDPGWQEKFDRDHDGVGCES